MERSGLRSPRSVSFPAPLPDVSAAAGTPAHLRIEQWLQRAIGDGELVAGDRLPAETDLARALGVSRTTLRSALGRLERRGVVERRRGRVGGTFIATPRVECDLTGLTGFTEQMRGARMQVAVTVVSAATVAAAGAVARALSLAPGTEVHEVIRVRSASGEPMAMERSCLPAAMFPDLLDQPLAGSLFDLLADRYRQRPHTANESLEAVAATPAEARLLDMPAAAPLLLVERTVFTAAGLAVEFANDLFRPDRVNVNWRVAVSPAAGAFS